MFYTELLFSFLPFSTYFYMYLFTLLLTQSHSLPPSFFLSFFLSSLNIEQNLPVVAPGILSWTDDDIAELYQSTTRDVASQINAVKGDWKDVIRSAALLSILSRIDTMYILSSSVFYEEHLVLLYSRND